MNGSSRRSTQENRGKEMTTTKHCKLRYVITACADASLPTVLSTYMSVVWVVWVEFMNISEQKLRFIHPRVNNIHIRKCLSSLNITSQDSVKTQEIQNVWCAIMLFVVSLLPRFHVPHFLAPRRARACLSLPTISTARMRGVGVASQLFPVARNLGI